MAWALGAPPAVLTLASTTSTAHSGLFDHLWPLCLRDSAVAVNVLAVRRAAHHPALGCWGVVRHLATDSRRMTDTRNANPASSSAYGSVEAGAGRRKDVASDGSTDEVL